MVDDVSSDSGATNVPVKQVSPGIVVLMVGPSGAGKDALLQGAAGELRSDTRFVFPKRVISRPSHDSEQHERASIDEMITAEHSGAYALSWRAHGLLYGISSQIDDAVSAGSIIVFNASRAVVVNARKRYSSVVVVYVDAPRDIRAKRLAARGRETEQKITERLAREVSTFRTTDADVVICNDGSLEDGVDQLASALRQTAKLSAADCNSMIK